MVYHDDDDDDDDDVFQLEPFEVECFLRLEVVTMHDCSRHHCLRKGCIYLSCELMP